MAQSVARHIGNVEVTGSIPVSSLAKLKDRRYFVFQLFLCEGTRQAEMLAFPCVISREFCKRKFILHFFLYFQIIQQYQCKCTDQNSPDVSVNSEKRNCKIDKQKAYYNRDNIVRKRRTCFSHSI